MPDFKKPRHAIPCSADPGYDDHLFDEADFYCRRPRPKPKDHRPKKDVQFVCGTAVGLSLPIFDVAVASTSGGPSSSFGLVAGTVNLDTSGMAHPATKVDFSSIINFLINLNEYSGGLLLQIDFRLSKICDGHKVHLGTWTYKRSISIGGALSPGVQLQSVPGFSLQVDFREPFIFSFCECDPCPAACCTYIVEIVNVNSFSIASASLTNVSISALAVDQ